MTFGMRCPDSVRHTVVKALEGRDGDVKFYEIREYRADFKLKRHHFDGRDIAVGYPARALSALEGFEFESPSSAS